MAFKRGLSNEIIEQLKSEPLFKRMEEDIHSGAVFPAIRNNQIDFYYQGGGLFHYDGNTFKTHIKYTVADYKNINKNYVSEDELNVEHLIIKFSHNYGQIKANCANFSQEEPRVFSALHRNSYISAPQANIVLLDKEIAFSETPPEQEKDRNQIDLLLYNKVLAELKFIEAKLYKNDYLKNGKAINQVKWYEKQIDRSKNEILTAYIEYIRKINQLFGLSIPQPQKINPNTGLFITQFDEDQRKGKLKMIQTEIRDNKIKVYAKGGLRNVSLDTLWKKLY